PRWATRHLRRLPTLSVRTGHLIFANLERWRQLKSPSFLISLLALLSRSFKETYSSVRWNSTRRRTAWKGNGRRWKSRTDPLTRRPERLQEKCSRFSPKSSGKWSSRSDREKRR